MEVMNSGWTEKELCTLYRDAKNKKEQIRIIAELLGMSSTRFAMEILERGGCLELKDDKKSQILEKYHEGLSDGNIARETGIAQSQVSTFLRGEGLPPNGKPWGGKRKEPVVLNIPEIIPESKISEIIQEEEKREVVKDLREPEVKQEKQTEVLESLKSETKKNYDELREVLPKSIPDPDDMPINYDVIETLTPQQYYELAKMTIQSINSMIETLRTVWEG